MEIAESARKHGITDDAIRHAWHHAIRFRQFEYDGEDRLLAIGPDPSGMLLELIARPGFAPKQVIHADRVRPKYYKYLR